MPTDITTPTRVTLPATRLLVDVATESPAGGPVTELILGFLADATITEVHIPIGVLPAFCSAAAAAVTANLQPLPPLPNPAPIAVSLAGGTPPTRPPSPAPTPAHA